MNRLLFLVLVLGVTLAGAQTGLDLPRDLHLPRRTVIAVKNVNVIPMTLNQKVIENATVLIQGNRILSINGEIPDSAEIIDGKGRWLIPGLIDMHVHIPVDGHFNTNYPTRAAAIFTNTQHIMTPFVANGITTVFELNARAGHMGQRNEILRGDIIGPRIALAGMIDGGEGDGRVANTPADGRQAVRLIKAEGYEFIKVYSKLNSETYLAIVDEAAKVGMKVAGHIPNAFKGRIAEAFVPHFGLVAHAEELFKQTEGQSDRDVKKIAQTAKANGTWLCPTLGIIHAAAEQGKSLDSLRASPLLPYVHPLLQSKWLTANNYSKHATPESLNRLRRMMEFNNQLVKAFRDAGVPVVAGTDAGSSGVVWGFSMHRELELLVHAGMTPEEVLISATRLPATWLGIDRFAGTVEAGKLADLVLLDANPLQDIRNTQKIAGVFVNGKWLDKERIRALLEDLAKQNAANKAFYDWNKRSEY